MLCSATRHQLILFAALAGVAVPASSAFAGNIYPTNLGQSTNLVNTQLAGTVTLSFLLNDNGTSTNIEVLDSSNNVVRTMSGLPTTKGSHNVVWDAKDDSNNYVPAGDYSFRVNTAGAASGAWTLYSVDSTLNNFELPRGVAVNKNPDSPYYGRVYVSNPRTNNTGAGRVMGDGIYMLNADISDTGILGGTGPHTAGVDWTTDGTGAVAPYRLEVGPDDSLYITDWSDARSALFQAGPNVTSGFEVLDSTGRDGVGLNATHGSVADVIVTGTGASRTIYSIDEDWIPLGGSTGNILRYDIGNTATFNGAPSAVVYDDAAQGSPIINFTDSIAQANDGTIWLSQFRSGGANPEPSLLQIDATGSIIWSSVPSLAADSLNDPLRGTQSIAYDPLNNVIALVSNRAGLITIFDATAKTVLASFNFGGTTNTDVAFDDAGNLYAANRSAERLRLWGPPNGNVGGRDYAANAFATSSLGPLGTITVVPEPASVLLMTLGLVAFGSFRRRNA